MELWTNGKPPKTTDDWVLEEIEKNKEMKRQQRKQITLGKVIFWYIVVFCVIGAIFGGHM